MKKPLALIILDGYGVRDDTFGNAIKAAKTPVMDQLLATCPHTLLGASGRDVGLPEGQMGNSEVGHTNIGAGRIVYQELTRITKAVEDGDFFENPILLKAVKRCKEQGTTLHLMGLVSDGGVHSHQEHLYALLRMAKREGLKRVAVHAFMDGRDVSPTSGIGYLEQLERVFKEEEIGMLSTIVGRYYAMDRDQRWQRVETAYRALVLGEGERTENWKAAMERSYQEEVTDEFIRPIVLPEGPRVQPNDSVVFFNFRPDRARQLTRAFCDPEFQGFDRPEGYFPLYFVCMTQYDAKMPGVEVAFQPQELRNTLGEVLSKKGFTQLRIAETEKYAHVTFFLNGGMEQPYPGEVRVLVPSPKVATYDLKPEMSAYEVAQQAIQQLRSGTIDVMILNFANCDMVGHTGVFDAAVKAVEVVDECLGKIVGCIEELGGISLITADHGNADQLLEPDGKPMTAHTTNPVWFIVKGWDGSLREGGRLCDIAPTMLELLEIIPPEEMSGQSIMSKR